MVLLALLGSFCLGGPLDDGLAAMKEGRAADARAALTRAAAEDPRSEVARWELGWACWSLRDWAGARAAWEEAAALGSTREDLPMWLEAARVRARLAARPAPAGEVPTAPAGARITFAAAGDTMLGSDLQKGEAGTPPGDGFEVLAPAAPHLSAADVAFLNLEGALGDGLPSTKCGPSSTSCYAFRMPTRLAAALPRAGVDVVSNANNHAMDLGPAGMVSTLAALDRVGVAHASRWGDVARLERDGVVIAVLAAHSGTCCLSVNEPDEVARAVAEADEWADIVVLSMHAGAEGAGARNVPHAMEIGYGERRGDVVALAHAAIDAGADLVLGHGPHVLRAIEVYRERLVVYSLGNFTGYRQFGMKGGYGGTSAIVEAELAANGVLVSARVHPYLLDGQSIPRPDPAGAAWEQIRELTAADFPETGVRVGPDGALSWGPAR